MKMPAKDKPPFFFEMDGKQHFLTRKGNRVEMHICAEATYPDITVLYAVMGCGQDLKLKIEEACEYFGVPLVKGEDDE